MPPTWVERLRQLPPPAHHPALATAKYPPTILEDVYARGQFGIDDLARPQPEHAAVLILLREGGFGAPEVLLTVRSKTMRRHGGEVALPGGKRDAGDAGDKYTSTLGKGVPPSRWTVDVTTALREAWEEVGLPSEHVEILAELPRCVALGGILTTPVVAWLPGGAADFSCPDLNPEEVSSAFWMPLRRFLEAERHTHKDILQGTVRMHAFEVDSVDGTKVFGLTANVMIRAAQLALGQDPAFAMFVGEPTGRPKL